VAQGLEALYRIDL